MRHVSGCLVWCSGLKSAPVYRRVSFSPTLFRYTRTFQISAISFHKPRTPDMLTTQATTGEVTGELDAHPDSKQEAENLEEVSSSTKQKKQKGQPKKRDTHFLCFPLVTDISIPQLAKSLRHFREVTTKPFDHSKGQSSRDRENETPETELRSEVQFNPSNGADTDAIEPNTNQVQQLTSSNSGLQILPAIAHRPPGTFHLTLGVMDLSTKEEMERALKLLQELDYAAILQEVLSQSEELEHETERRDDETLRQPEVPLDADNEDGSAILSLKRPVSPPETYKTDKHIARFSKDSPPSISLTGLSTFPSAKASRVFYAKPSPSPGSPFPLLRFGQAVRQKFREAHFITETRPLVLHATVANMRYAVQARGGRTSKGKSWKYGKDRWKAGQVDARELIKCFDHSEGNVEEYVKGSFPSDGSAQEFVWAKDIVIDRVAICKMGAEKSDDEILGAVYPPVGEEMIY